MSFLHNTPDQKLIISPSSSLSLLFVDHDQVFGMAWSPDGKLLATVCKDGKVRIYDPRKSTTPVQVLYVQQKWGADFLQVLHFPLI